MGRKKKTAKLTTRIQEVARDKKRGNMTATVEQIAYYNMCLTEALFEVLAEKGIVTGSEVMERIKKLKSETEFQSTRLQ
jgi:hypothetical protein